MIKFYEPVIIKHTDSLTEVIKKINLSKNKDNHFPVGVFIKGEKLYGILSLGDIRRLSLKKVNLNDLATKHLNRKFFFYRSKIL